MAQISLGGTPVKTIGNLPEAGTTAPHFKLVKTDLTTSEDTDYRGKKVILNIFPSVNTRVCAQSVRQFNKEAAALENTVVLCISKDLPFAQEQFCGAEGISNVVLLSDFRTGAFGKDYGVTFTTGAFEGLLSRAIVILDENGKVLYTEQVPETGEEPNYSAALESISHG